MLSDPAAERAVLAGICKYGADAYLDVADIIQDTTFTIDSNQIIYKCLQHVLQDGSYNKVDIASIYSSANDIGVGSLLENKDEVQHLRAIVNLPVNLENIRRQAAKIRKLQIARLLREQLENAQDKLLEIKGGESIVNILGIAENAIFDFSSLLNEKDDIKTLEEGALKHISELMENPVDQIGIPTGFPLYDEAIGGGLRTGVSVMGARLKVGKSFFLDNVAKHISLNLNIPVLNLDTEMNWTDHLYRMIAIQTGVPIKDIETGRCGEKPDIKNKVLEELKKWDEKGTNYHYRSIKGMQFEDQMAIMRRWLYKDVGLNDDGTAKPCVILYDYLKLMTHENITSDLKEYQLLGFMMTSLQNFAQHYDIPILCFVQLNRDGIDKESTGVVGGSDRIGQLCINLSLMKEKSDEEIAEDGAEAGNRKLVPLISRNSQWDTRDYININFKGYCGQMIEGETKFQLQEHKVATKDKDFEILDDGEDIPFN